MKLDEHIECEEEGVSCDCAHESEVICWMLRFWRPLFVTVGPPPPPFRPPAPPPPS